MKESWLGWVVSDNLVLNKEEKYTKLLTVQLFVFLILYEILILILVGDFWESFLGEVILYL